MRELYNQINNILSRVDFDCIWSGFSQMPFALYNKSEVYLENSVIPRDDRFFANTAIDLDGKQTAIWMIDGLDGEDTDIIAANIVHEMFHAFQRECGEARYPNDLMTLGYPDDKDNYQIKHMENKLLARSCSESALAEKSELLRRFIGLRKRREELIGESIRCEYLTETFEGMAEYAGMMALKQISPVKYAERVKNYADMLGAPDEGLFNIRRISYYSGAVLCIIASELGLPVQHDIAGAEKTVFELLSGTVAPAQSEKTEYAPELDKAHDRYMSGKRKRIDDFLESSRTRTDGEYRICGYDPNNMIRVGDRVLNTHFVMLMDIKENEKLSFFEPVLLEMAKGSANMAVAYLK